MSGIAPGRCERRMPGGGGHRLGAGRSAVIAPGMAHPAAQVQAVIHLCVTCDAPSPSACWHSPPRLRLRLLRDLLHAAVQPPELRSRGLPGGGDAVPGHAEPHLEITNPNAVGISLSRIDYALSVEGSQVVSGAPSSGLHIPPPAPPSSRSRPRCASRTWRRCSRPSWRRTPRATAPRGLGHQHPGRRHRPAARHRGQFEVPKVPEVQLQSPRVSDINLMGATSSSVHRHQPEHLRAAISSVSGALEIAGARVGTVSLEASASSPPPAAPGHHPGLHPVPGGRPGGSGPPPGLRHGRLQRRRPLRHRSIPCNSRAM